MTHQSHTALLLTNLGSPDSTSVEDVKKYLTDFLMDERVIDFPYWFRFLLMRCIVVPKRAPKSAEAYRKIWTKEGSPLIIESEKLAQKVREKAPFPVGLSMRYGNPSTKSTFEALLQQDPQLKNVIVLPLYPQYTMSSFDTAVEEIKRVHRKEKYSFNLQFLNPFYDNSEYIKVLAASIRPYVEQDYDRILFSYHGLPVRHLTKDEKRIAAGGADFALPPINYQKQALETTRLVAESLGIPKEKYETSFQSRLESAGNEWIKPYTAERLAAIPREGVKKLLVACPAFINDCLETIEEIGMEGKETFKENGGENLTLIPCLNDDDALADLIVKWAAEGQ